MSKLRTRLENYVVRQTGDLVDDLHDERRSELAEVLHEIEGYSPRTAEAEERIDELVSKLENRNAALAKSRARIEELERELDQGAVRGRTPRGPPRSRARRGAHPAGRTGAEVPRRARGP